MNLKKVEAAVMTSDRSAGPLRILFENDRSLVRKGLGFRVQRA